MSRSVDLHDVQGNVARAYGSFGFPKARYLLLFVSDSRAGRAFLLNLLPEITTSAPWRASGAPMNGDAPPDVTTNIAFTFSGLRAIGVPEASLQSFPAEYAMGMRARREVLGDTGPSAPERWDPVWETSPHILLSLNGRNEELLEARYRELCKQWTSGVTLMSGHSGSSPDYQSASVLYDKQNRPTSREHFGYRDGISNPYFKGLSGHPSKVIGGGKPIGRDPEKVSSWKPLETGEFLLGHRDEAFEEAPSPRPTGLGHNGSYLVYRKLHQNVGSFDSYLDQIGAEYPGGKEELAAKFAGRWRNGAPLASFPTEKEAEAHSAKWIEAKAAIFLARTPQEKEEAKLAFSKLNLRMVGFDYAQDLSGGKCPLGAHVRRTNPRGALEFGAEDAYDTPAALTNRRRLLRRGLPYGESVSERKDEGDHGIIFMALGANIRRQFEFVQQEWINYGNDFRLANEKDPLLGDHGTNYQEGDGSFIIPAPPEGERPPFFCSRLPRFVETRGGDYFFIPSLTALRMMAHGIIDPT